MTDGRSDMWLKKTMLALSGLFFLAGCANQSKPAPPHSDAAAGTGLQKSVSRAPRQNALPERCAPLPEGQDMHEFKIGGDFAGGGAVGDVIADMSVKGTIEQLLDKKAKSISLKQIAEYAERPKHADWQIFKERDCSFLHTLCLTNTGIDDSDLEALSGLKLISLTLSDCSVKDLHAIKEMQTLTVLNVSGCPINSAGVEVISGLKNLGMIDLARTQITDSDLEKLGCLTGGKRSLILSDCPRLSPAAVDQFRLRHTNIFVHFNCESKEVRMGYTDIMRVHSSLVQDGEYDEADMSLQGLIKRWQAQVPPPYPLIARAIRMRAECQTRMKRDDLACSLLAQSIDIYARYIPNNAEYPVARVDLAVLLEKMGRLPEAIAQRKAAEQFWTLRQAEAVTWAASQANKAWLAKHH